MMPDEEASGEAAAVETIIPTAHEAVVSSQDDAPTRDFESEARAMGWVPEAEWKGDKRPAKFLDAEAFVERGETVIPILKSQLAKKDQEWADRFSKLEKMTEKTIKKQAEQHAQELAALQASREAAVEAGDVTTFRKIDKQIAAHEKATPELLAEAKAPEQANEEAVAAWRKENAWYETDDDLTEAAIGISQNILRKNPNITMAENLRQTTEKMRERFPLKLGGKTGANGHAPVDGGALNGAPPRKETLFSKLPAEAQRQAKLDVANKVYANVEDWAKAYNS